jgi:4-amino-4-deoxy-L-arabinose transferase-like glycosyltransferase
VELRGVFYRGVEAALKMGPTEVQRSGLRFSYGFALLVLLLLFVLINARWIWVYRHGQPLDIDEAGYLVIALVDYYALVREGVVEWLAAVWAPSIQAPLTTALSSLLFYFTGPHVIVGFAVPLLAGAGCILATYFLGKSVGSRQVGLVASILVASCPVTLNYSRSFHFSMPATLAVTVTLLALAKSNRFERVGWGMLFGVSLGLMPLARTMAIAFVPGVVIGAFVYTVAEPLHRIRRVLMLSASLPLAVLTAATWLGPSSNLVFQYLFSFGYGARAVEYGPEQSMINFATWLYTVQTLAAYIYLPHLVLLIAGAGLLVFFVIRLIVTRGWAATFRITLNSRLVPAVILVAAGLVALTSARNKGSAFIAPLVPAMLVISVWSLGRLRQSGSWNFITAGLAISVATLSCISLIDLRLSSAQPWVVNVPVLGPTIVTDGRGTIQRYQAEAGYSSRNPTIPIDSSVGEAWIRANATTAQRLTETARLGLVGGRMAVGLRGYLYNGSTIDLAQLLAGRGRLPLTPIVPELTGDSIDGYLQWLRSGETATACILLTASGNVGEIRPVVNEENIKSAARKEGFSPLDQWPLPDGRVVTMWTCLTPAGEHLSGATFGSWATLESYSYQRTRDAVALSLHWRAIQPLNPNILVAIHLIDEQGHILAQYDYSRAKGIPAGETAVETVIIPQSQLNGATRRLAITLYTKDGMVAPVDRGSRDWDGHRLLLDPPH